MTLAEKHKKLITNLLLAFVLITIGFSLGKHNALPKVAVNGDTTLASNSKLADGKKVVKIFYMHSTFRCVTCNGIESRAREIVEKDFAEAKNNDTILWEDVNFQENELLARQFDVVASCIVVSVMQNNEIIEFEKLDEVWTLIEKPAEFDAYVKAALNKALTKVTGA